MTIYFIGVVLIAWAFSVLAWLLEEQLGNWAQLMMLPLAIAPFIMAYIAHRSTGAIGNPFKGLVWGKVSWYFMVWLGMSGLAILALALAWGLKMLNIDLEMGGYREFLQQQMAAQGMGGQPLPESAVRVQGYITTGAALVIGPWFGAAFACLSTFPQFGWFGRRLMVKGRTSMFLWLAIISVLASIPAGLVPNPNLGDTTMPLRMLVMGVTGLGYLPISLWVFLKTRSAVLAALATTSFGAILTAAMPFAADYLPWLAGTGGVLYMVIVLLGGIALWVIADPGGDDLAVAAVAYDGTPLTPKQAKAYESGAMHDVERLTSEPAADLPPEE